MECNQICLWSKSSWGLLIFKIGQILLRATRDPTKVIGCSKGSTAKSWNNGRTDILTAAAEPFERLVPRKVLSDFSYELSSWATDCTRIETQARSSRSIFWTPWPQGVRRTTQKWDWTPPPKVGSVLFASPYEGVYVAAQRKKIFCVPSKLICRASFCAMTNLIAENDQAHRAWQ